MKVVNCIISLMALGTLTACDQKELEFGYAFSDEEIRLTADLVPQAETRATSQSHLSDATHFATGQPVALFIIEHRPSPVAYTGALHTMTTGESNALNFNVGDNCLWPGDTPVDFHAWYPYKADGPFAGKTSASTTTFTVSSDQSAEATYSACDLLFASSINVSKPNPIAAVPLTFTHALSQVIVVLQSTNDQLTDEELATAQVTIDGTAEAPLYLDANVDIDGGTANYLSTGTTTTQLKLGTGATTFAVLPPGQSLLGKVVHFTLDGIETKSYTINTIDGLLAGKKYTITLSLTLSTFTVTETMVDWQSGGDDRDKSGNPLYI